jgi:oligoribonuclease
MALSVELKIGSTTRLWLARPEFGEDRMAKSHENREPITDHLLWLDLETTGSSEKDGDEIIEIGCVLTTHDLYDLGSFTSVVKPGPLALGRMMQNQIVREMHEKNGLLPKVLAADDELRPHKVVNQLLAWLSAALPPDGFPVVLAGSGVGHFDRRFIDKYMPQLSQQLRYWCIDIGVIRRAHDMWVGTTVSTDNDRKTHRAIDDAYCHLSEARAFGNLWRFTQLAWTGEVKY